MNGLIDSRCLEHDHHFEQDDLYDEYTGESLGAQQFKAKCTRCGKTLGESLSDITTEIEQILNERTN